MNELGDATDVTIRDCSAVPTNLLEELPYTARMLEGLGLDIMWARLARLTANNREQQRTRSFESTRTTANSMKSSGSGDTSR